MQHQGGQAPPHRARWARRAPPQAPEKPDPVRKGLGDMLKKADVSVSDIFKKKKTFWNDIEKDNLVSKR